MDLLALDVTRIAPEESEAAKDRAPDELASGTPEPQSRARALLADRLRHAVVP
jgi:hypothetical protein